MMRSLLMVLCLLLPAAVLASAPAGEITLATGLATATSRDGSVRNIAMNSKVYSGEFINTGPNSYLNIKFRDGGRMMLRPNTRFQIEQFEFESAPTPAVAAQPDATTTAEPPKPVPRSNRQVAVFRLIKGGLRTVTGLIGKKDFADYRMNTPTATIGIRGTEFQSWTCDLACVKDPVVSAALKAAFGDDFNPLGTEVIGTFRGVIVVKNNETGESKEVKPGQFILSTPQGDIPLPREPDFIAKDRIPAC